MKRVHEFLGVSLAAGLLLSACKQGVGDRCQVSSDCESGLICALGNNSSLTGGTCQSTGGGGGVDAATQDTGVPDLSGTDSAMQDGSAAADLAMENDLATSDLTPVD